MSCWGDKRQLVRSSSRICLSPATTATNNACSLPSTPAPLVLRLHLREAVNYPVALVVIQQHRRSLGDPRSLIRFTQTIGRTNVARHAAYRLKQPSRGDDFGDPPPYLHPESVRRRPSDSPSSCSSRLSLGQLFGSGLLDFACLAWTSSGPHDQESQVKHRQKGPSIHESPRERDHDRPEVCE